MDKDEQYILDELAYAAGRPTWFEISGNLAIKLQEMMTRKDAEIDRLREDLDLTQKIARIEIDAKLRYAWALSEIIKLKPDEEFGAVPIETAQRIASEALKWKE